MVDVYKRQGEANASVELTPNMAGPAFDALEKYKKDGTLPENDINLKQVMAMGCWSEQELVGEQGHWQAKKLNADASQWERCV